LSFQPTLFEAVH